MTSGFLLRYTVRELRGALHQLLYFVVCLAIGVAAVVVVAGLSRGLDSGIRGEAKDLLAADLSIRGGQPIPREALDLLIDQAPGSAHSRVREMVTIVAAARSTGIARSQLVELKVVDEAYPFYGDLEIEPSRSLASLLVPDGVVVAPDLLARLDIDVGDRLLIGGHSFEIKGTVLNEPDRIGGAFTLGPRIFLSEEGLALTPLESTGSRVEHRLLIQLPAATPLSRLHSLAAALESVAPRDQGFRVETYEEAQPALRRGLTRLERYLGLIALLSLLIGGVGVGQAVRTWVASRMDAIAVLKCLGVRPREAFCLYLGQAFLLGGVGSAAGCLAGMALLTILPLFLRDLVPSELLDSWQPIVMVRGMALGLGVTALFSLPPLTRVLRVPPARVLRQDAEPLSGTRSMALATGVTLILGVGLLASAQAGSVILGAQFTGGLLATAVALAIAASALTAGVRRLPRELGRVWLRYGLASLARPGAATLGAIVALGLGLLVVFATSQVQSRLREQIQSELPKNAPSVFFIDVQPGQWAPLQELLESQGADQIQSVPMVMARLRAIDGRSTTELVEESGRGGRKWAMTREQRLTYLDTLPEGNTLISGSLWGDPERLEISVEEEFAQDLGVELGSELELDIQGLPMSFTVTSLRSVEWESFAINFFLIAEPGALEEAPQLRLATAQLPRGSEQQTQDLIVSAFPNITVVKVREILEKIVALLERLGWGISFLGGFTLICGLVILAATVAVESSRRGREVALLKTLGMQRRGVMALFATEYALLGLVAGLIGAAGGGVVAWIALTRGMELQWTFAPAAYARAVAWSVALSTIAGVGASWGALQRRPSESLRHN